MVRRVCATILDPEGDTDIRRWADDLESPKLDPEDVQAYQQREDLAELYYPLFLTRGPTASAKRCLQEINASDLTQAEKERAITQVKSEMLERRRKEFQKDFEEIFGGGGHFKRAVDQGYEVAISIKNRMFLGPRRCQRLVRKAVSLSRKASNLTDDSLAAVVLAHPKMSEFVLKDPLIDDFSLYTRQQAIDTALIFASLFGEIEKMKRLISAGANVKKAMILSRDCFDSMQIAAARGHLKVMQLLVEHGVNPGDYQPGVTPLNFAARWGHVPVVEWLLALHVHEARENELETSLHHAVVGENIEVVRLLLSYDTDLNIPQGSLYEAVSGPIQILEMLLECGAPGVMNALRAAVRLGALEKFQLLLGFVSVEDFNSDFKEELLSRAAKEGHCKMMEELLNAGAAPGAALSVAVNWGQLEGTQLLIARGADANGVNSQGVSLLSLALRRSENRDELVKALLNAGADPYNLEPITLASKRRGQMRLLETYWQNGCVIL